MPLPCYTSSSPAIHNPTIRHHHPVLFHHLVSIALHRSLQIGSQTGKLPLQPALWVCLCLKGKLVSTSVDYLGCKPIPAKLSPFSPPVLELLQHGCSLQWPGPAGVQDWVLQSVTAPLKTPPTKQQASATGVSDFLLLLLSVFSPFDLCFSFLSSPCFTPSHTPLSLKVLVARADCSHLDWWVLSIISSYRPPEQARCPSLSHKNTQMLLPH